MGGDFFAKLEGGNALRKQLRRLEPEFHALLSRELPKEAAALMADAQALVPRDSGELASTATVSEHVGRGKVKAVAAYTDEKAAAVHEGIHHNRKVIGTKGFKWFERAFNAFQTGFVGRIAGKLKGLL